MNASALVGAGAGDMLRLACCLARSESIQWSLLRVSSYLCVPGCYARMGRTFRIQADGDFNADLSRAFAALTRRPARVRPRFTLQARALRVSCCMTVQYRGGLWSSHTHTHVNAYACVRTTYTDTWRQLSRCTRIMCCSGVQTAKAIATWALFVSGHASSFMPPTSTLM